MMKHNFNDLGSMKLNVLTLNMRLNNNAIPLDSRVFIVVTNHQSDLPVDLETCVCLEIILLNEA